jgi:thioredoxin-related protein
MKKSCLLAICTLLAITLFSQTDSTLPPYKRFPSFPPVRLLNTDSSSFFTKTDLDKKASALLILFNPQCEHCQQETAAIIKHIDKFRHIQIVMATYAPFDSMMAFRERYQLANYKNIVVAQDTHYFLTSFFTIHSLPFLAFYNRKKELITVFEGSMPIEKVLAIFEK